MKTKNSAPKNLPSGPELDRLYRPFETSPRSQPQPLGAVRRALTKIVRADCDPAARNALERAEAEDRARRAALLRRPGAPARELKRSEKLLAASLASRIGGFRSLVGEPQIPGRPEYHLLDQPYLIWADFDLQDSAIVPVNSWAKFIRRSEDGGPNATVSVRFHYWWRNDRDTAAVINVNGYTVFQGEWSYGVGSGLLWGDRQIKLTVGGSLQLIEWWKTPATNAPIQASQSATVLRVTEDQSHFGAVGAVDKQGLFRGIDLSYSTLIVPAQTVAIFTVVTQVTCETGEDDSLVTADFATGNFHVGSPAVLVSVF